MKFIWLSLRRIAESLGKRLRSLVTGPNHAFVQGATANLLPAVTADLEQLKRAGAHPATFIIQLQRAMDGALKATRPKPDCKSGCSYCCHYRVMASAAEILTMADFIHTRPLTEQTRIVKRLRANVDATAGLSVQQHESMNVECALLQDNKCLAYDVRPFACRKHHSFKVAACIETFHDPQSSTQNRISAARVAVAAEVIGAHAAGSVHAGLDSNMYELSAALFVAMTDTESMARWKHGKVTFPTVRDRQAFAGAMF